MRLAATLCLSLLVFGTACTRNASPDVYTRSATVSKVMSGMIVSARPVTIKDNQTSGQLGAGSLGGGIVGGVAGSTLGKSEGKTLAALGGVVAGAVIGHLIEDNLSTQQATEYVIRLDRQRPEAAKGTLRSQQSRRNSPGSNVADDINSSLNLEETESNMLAVVQADTTPLAIGQRVLLIYNDDLPRVIADPGTGTPPTLGPAFVPPAPEAMPEVTATPIPLAEPGAATPSPETGETGETGGITPIQPTE